MMKKLIVVAAAALVAAGAQAASYKDGSYTGEGKGLLRGSVVVEHGKYLGEVTEVVADGITYQGCTSGNGKFIPYGLGYDLLKRS